MVKTRKRFMLVLGILSATALFVSCALLQVAKGPGHDVCDSIIPMSRNLDGSIHFVIIKTPCELGDVGRMPITGGMISKSVLMVECFDPATGELKIVLITQCLGTEPGHDHRMIGYLYKDESFLYDSRGNPVKTDNEVFAKYIRSLDTNESI